MKKDAYIRCENHGMAGMADMGADYDFVGLFLSLPNPQGQLTAKEGFCDDKPLYDIYHCKPDVGDNCPPHAKSYDEFVEKATKVHATFDPETFEKPTVRVQNLTTGKVWDRITMRRFVELMIADPPVTFKYAFSPVGLA